MLRTIGIATIAFATQIGLAGEARAQDASATSTDDEAVVEPAAMRRVIEEVVVTARKTEENLQDVPVAVTAFSAGDLEDTTTFEMEDLSYRVPNVVIGPGPGQGTALVMQIRGQVQNDILGTLDPSVGFYDDGVYVARPHGANAAFFDVQSLQVLRGPQGTLFGRNTTGGAILLTTNDPSFERVEGSVGVTFGSFERRTLNAVANAPILADQLAFRLAAQTTRTDGYAFDGINRREVASEGRDFVRAKLLWEPRDDLRFTLKGQWTEIDELGTPMKGVFALEQEDAVDPTVCCLLTRNALVEGIDYDSFIRRSFDRVFYDDGLKPTNEGTIYGVDLTTVWEHPWATVKLIVGVRENDGIANRIDIDGSPSVAVDTFQTNENAQQSYELQFTGDGEVLGRRLSWAAGAYYFDEDGRERATTSVFLPVAAAISPIRTFGDIENDSVGGYVQATYEVWPDLRITGGVRHTRDGKKLVLRPRMGPPLPANLDCAMPAELRDDPNECQGSFDDSFSNTSFTLGADYGLFEDTLVYASVTTGYRSGGQNLRGTSVETLTPFDSEELMQLEAGFKSELFDRRVRVNAAGFHTFYDDIQRSIIIASDSALPATVVSNAAEATVSGAEIELSALTPIEGLALSGFYGLTLPSYQEFEDVTGDRSGEEFDIVAKHSYSILGSYTRAVGVGQWHSVLDWAWKDEIPSQEGGERIFAAQGADIENLVTQPPTGILSARTGISLPLGLDLTFYGRNLTDERTFVALALGGGPDFVTRLVTNAGRELGFQATYRF